MASEAVSGVASGQEKTGPATKASKNRPSVARDKRSRLLESILVGNGCWLWTGLKSNCGYGLARLRGHNMGAHRAVYILFRGPIPAETLDHLCRTPLCVRPSHLEPVSFRENKRRALPTHCKRGHPLDDPGNYFYVQSGWNKRVCKPCALAYGREQRKGGRRDRTKAKEIA